MAEPAQILLTTTENYLSYVKAFIKNIIALNRYPINFYILYGFEKTETEVERFYAEINNTQDYKVYCKRVPLELMRELEQQPLEKVNSQNLRLYLHLLNLHGKLLYLDIDILVCRNFSHLFTMDLEGKTIGAVVDYNLMYRNQRTNGKYFHKKLQEPLASKTLTFTDERYINSGVLLIDLDLLTQRQTWVRNLPLLHKFTAFADQSFLNYVHYADIKYLPVEYNYLAYHLINNRAIAYKRGILPVENDQFVPNLQLIRPVFLHFAGRQKQWNNTAREFQDAYKIFEQPLEQILHESEEFYTKYFDALFEKYGYTQVLVDPIEPVLTNSDKKSLTILRENENCHPLIHNYKLLGNLNFKDFWDGIFLTKVRDTFNEEFYQERNK